jgi:hypothetical protein
MMNMIIYGFIVHSAYTAWAVAIGGRFMKQSWHNPRERDSDLPEPDISEKAILPNEAKVGVSDLIPMVWQAGWGRLATAADC